MRGARNLAPDEAAVARTPDHDGQNTGRSSKRACRQNQARWNGGLPTHLPCRGKSVVDNRFHSAIATRNALSSRPARAAITNSEVRATVLSLSLVMPHRQRAAGAGICQHRAGMGGFAR